MLVLSRKIGEELHIGDNTVVFVQAISGNRVRLGIQAPRETRVLRGELTPFHSKNLSVDTQACDGVAGNAVTENRPRRVAR
jgi:carbon storage regulator CsrA